MDYLDAAFAVDRYRIIPGVQIEPSGENRTAGESGGGCEKGRSDLGLEGYFKEKLRRYYDTHMVSVNLPETARFFFSGKVRWVADANFNQ